MKHLSMAQALVIAAILLVGAQTLAQTPVSYHSRRPTTGSPAVAYRWYICRPDSNTLIFQTTTSDTIATIVHQGNGERVRVVAVDALNRAGPCSFASEAWLRMLPTNVPTAVALQLHPAYPNPFNPRTTIPYSLPQAGRVTLAIYDVRGARVATLVDADLPAGEQSAAWSGADDRGAPMPSGLYFARLETAAGVRTVKLTLSK